MAEAAPDPEEGEAGEKAGMSDSVRNVLFAIGALVSYLVFGVIVYAGLLEEWTVVDALYFCIVTVTTVGYGDICPSSTASKMFTCFMAFFGVTLIGIALGVIATFVIEKQQAALANAKKLAAAKMEADMAAAEAAGDGKGPPKSKAAAAKSAEQQAKADAQRAKLEALQKKMGGGNPVHMKMLKAFLPIIVIVLVISLFEGPYEGWSFIDSVYFAVITSTTVGYGDISPQKPLDRSFACLYIPIAVVAVGNALGQVADVYVEIQMQAANKSLLGDDITIDRLLEMDKGGGGGKGGGDGKVDETEFTLFMLQAMKAADKDLLDDLQKQFKDLDKDGSGFLDWADFKEGMDKLEEEAAAPLAEREPKEPEKEPLVEA